MILLQENVWDYPRPARCEPFAGTLKIIAHGHVLAETTSGFRTIETSHPPTYYFPPEDVNMALLERNQARSLCEWKGRASYFDLVTDQGSVPSIGWCYQNPTRDFRPLENHLSFYASKADACFVNGEEVQAQAGDFYGGWITRNLTGPFKGGPGTVGW